MSSVQHLYILAVLRSVPFHAVSGRLSIRLIRPDRCLPRRSSGPSVSDLPRSDVSRKLCTSGGQAVGLRPSVSGGSWVVCRERRVIKRQPETIDQRRYLSVSRQRSTDLDQSMTISHAAGKSSIKPNRLYKVFVFRTHYRSISPCKTYNFIFFLCDCCTMEKKTKVYYMYTLRGEQYHGDLAMRQ